MCNWRCYPGYHIEPYGNRGEDMPPAEHTVPVKYLISESADVETSGGLTAEMCTVCFALVPTDRVQEHIDRHPDWKPPPPPEPEVNPLPA
jgi:hypothetical protein